MIDPAGPPSRIPLAPQRLIVAISAWTLLALIFSSNLIPIGTVFGIPFRMTLYLIVVTSTVWLIFFTHGPRLQGAAAFFAALLGVILLAALNGLMSSQTPDAFVLDDLRTYLVTFSIPMIALLNVELKVVSARSIARAFVWGTLVYAAAKAAFFWVLIFIPGIARFLLVTFLRNSNASVVFGFVLPGVSRIQTGLDFSAIISLVMLLVDRDSVVISRFRAFGIAVLSFAVFITFSRALVALLVLVFVAYLVFSATGRVRVIGGITLSFAVGLIFVLGAQALQSRLETGQKGDQTRKPQADALLDLWQKAPLFGNGLGAFSRVVTRDKEAPFNYELQLHSIASKIGLVGILVFIALTLIAFFATADVLPNSVIGWPIGMLFAFLAAASTNPYMFSSAAANVYIALFVGFRAFETLPHSSPKRHSARTSA